MLNLEEAKLEFWDGKYQIDYEDEKDKKKRKTEQFYFDEEGKKFPSNVPSVILQIGRKN